MTLSKGESVEVERVREGWPSARGAVLFLRPFSKPDCPATRLVEMSRCPSSWMKRSLRLRGSIVSILSSDESLSKRAALTTGPCDDAPCAQLQ